MPDIVFAPEACFSGAEFFFAAALFPTFTHGEAINGLPE